MTVYLPIAELSVNILVILGMGAAVGFLSGMFGVGGGFLITPLLIFYNIPPVVAVATGANQVVASSISGAITHFRRGTIDIKLGCVLLVGGLIGASIGVWIFSFLRRIGQLDLVISLLYVVLLGVVGALMLAESLRAMRKVSKNQSVTLKRPASTTGCTVCPSRCASRSRRSISASSGRGARHGHRRADLGHGGRRRLYHGSRHDLSLAHPHQRGRRHLAVPDHLRFLLCRHRAGLGQLFRRYRAGLHPDGRRRHRAQYGVRVGQKTARRTAARALGLLVLAVGIRLAIDLVIPRPISIRSSPRGSAIDARPSPQCSVPSVPAWRSRLPAPCRSRPRRMAAAGAAVGRFHRAA